MFIVKDNEATLRKDIELFIQNEKLNKFTKNELNGGRIEKRTAILHLT